MQPPTDPRNPPKSSPPVPEMVGATSAPFYIGPGVTQISFPIHLPTGPALLRDLKERIVTLQIENVTSDKAAPGFKVYLDVPSGDDPEKHPELFAESLTTFGLVQSSDPLGEHGGTGKTIKLDVTSVFRLLTAKKDWDSQNLRVTFAPGYWDAPVPRVKIGRVSLYFS